MLKRKLFFLKHFFSKSPNSTKEKKKITEFDVVMCSLWSAPTCTWNNPGCALAIFTCEILLRGQLQAPAVTESTTETHT